MPMQQYLFGNDTPADGIEADVAAGLSLADARPYQLEMADSVFGCWVSGPKAMGCAATGVGKTFVAGMVADRVLRGELDTIVPNSMRGVCFITPRQGLTHQSAKELGALIPGATIEVEQGENRARGAADIVVACLASYSKKYRLQALGRNRFKAYIWDECHHYGPKNKMVRRVMSYIDPDARHLGITATPDRGDGVGLAAVFDRVAFEFDIWRAVEEGWLVKPYMAYDTSDGEVKLDGVPLTAEGEFDAKALADRMTEAGPVAAVVKAAVKWSNYANGYEGKRPTIVCCASVEHAKLVAILLNEWDKKSGGETGRAGAVYSKMDPLDKDAVVEAYRRGELRYICHFDVLTEGFDSDRPKLMINGRPTGSRWVFAQQAGRLLRPLKAIRNDLRAAPDAATRRALIGGSGKPGVLIVDVAGTTHKLTVSLPDVFHAPGSTKEDVERVKAKARRNGEDGKPTDPQTDFSALRRARELELAANWRGVTVDCGLTTRFTDPFDVLSVVPGREPPWHRGRKPTGPMKGCLLDAGIPAADVELMSFHRASKMIEVVKDRRKRGLCSYKVCKLLRKYGIDGAMMTKEIASAAIDAIANNGWRLPEGTACPIG